MRRLEPDDDFDPTIAVFETVPPPEPPKTNDKEKLFGVALTPLDLIHPVRDADVA
jgi:hypothetical protein